MREAPPVFVWFSGVKPRIPTCVQVLAFPAMEARACEMFQAYAIFLFCF